MAAIATCQACERAVAVKGAAIVEHDYRIIGHNLGGFGQHVGSSCIGTGHRPYELSCDLLPPLATSCDQAAARLDALRVTAAADPTMVVPARMVRGGWARRTFPPVLPSDPLYPLRKRKWLERLASEAAHARTSAAHYRQRMAEWKPRARAAA